MEIKKIETNFKHNLFMHETSNIKIKDMPENLEKQIINIYPDIFLNTFSGFGGAMTEASARCILSLSDEKINDFIDDYFSENGANYNIIRIPIASCDFSKESYEYVHKKDLSDFSIENDKKYIIPAIKRILDKKQDIVFLASPWSPPKFMKTNKLLTLGGRLKEKYKSLYADYLLKYIKSYQDEGITISYLTIQNEPNALQIWESCLYSPEEEIDLLVNYIYPLFKENNLNTKLLIWDHNKEKLLSRIQKEMSFENAKDRVSGFAFHWYSGDHFENIRILRSMYKDMFFVHTEGCTGFSGFRKEDEVNNAEIYAHDILGDLKNGTNAFIDWNLLLDHKGGPNHKKNYCNSPLMLNEDNTNYYKNLSYYYISHFSRFIKKNSSFIETSKYTDKIEVLASKKENEIIVILLNRNDQNYEYNLCINGKYLHDNLDSHSIITFVIK